MIEQIFMVFHLWLFDDGFFLFISLIWFSLVTSFHWCFHFGDSTKSSVNKFFQSVNSHFWQFRCFLFQIFKIKIGDAHLFC